MRNKPHSTKAKVVCLGNTFRGDDAVGLVVAEILEKRFGVKAVTVQSPAELLDHVTSDIDLLIVVDAVETTTQPGQIHRLDSSDLLDDLRTRTTHTVSLREMLSLLELVAGFRGRLIIYGVEGENFGFVESVSEKVRTSCEKVAEEIAGVLGLGDAGGGI